MNILFRLMFVTLSFVCIISSVAQSQYWERHDNGIYYPPDESRSNVGIGQYPLRDYKLSFNGNLAFGGDRMNKADFIPGLFFEFNEDGEIGEIRSRGNRQQYRYSWGHIRDENNPWIPQMELDLIMF